MLRLYLQFDLVIATTECEEKHEAQARNGYQREVYHRTVLPVLHIATTLCYLLPEE